MDYIFLFIILALVRAQEESKSIFITQGPVIGYKEPDLDVISFYGIPYATAPTGTEKFKAPLPPPVWTDPFEAVDQSIACPQYYTGAVPTPREDCLIANIHVPVTNETNLPVMVFFHGGGFQVGFSNWDTPKQLVNHKRNVVTITFNYRLGPHGFLCLGTEDVPGNAGMRDQVALLHWVKDNIASFGGNPDDVTIAGCSAGGASVDLQILSKMAKGLFTKVIGHSGANVGVFTVQVDPIENAKEHAMKLDYQGEDTIEDLEDFFKNLPFEKLTSVLYIGHEDFAVRFSPCVERDLGFERFLDDTPVNLIASGDYIQVPMLTGYASMEGLFRIFQFEDWKDQLNEDFSQFLPADLAFESIEQKKEVAERVKQFYFGDNPVSNENVQGYIDFTTDAMFVVAIHRSVTMQVQSGNNGVYLHVYSYTDNNSFPIPYIGGYGAMHCTETYTVLDEDESNITQEYRKMKDTMRDIWLNFIHTGNPTPEGQTPKSVPHWEPARENRSPCMHFGSTIELIGPYEEDRQKLWDDIYDRFHRAPVAPYDF